MLKAQEIADPTSCLNKAKDDEMVFVLRGKDLATPYTIRSWINMRIALGLNEITDPKIVEAYACADSIEKSHGDVSYGRLPQAQPIQTVQQADRAAEKGYKSPVDVLVEAMEKLTKLGNGDKLGNSDGNIIAQKALWEYERMMGTRA